MPTYKIDIQSGDTERQKKYDFRSEGNEPAAPQALIASHPEIILDIPELEIKTDANVIVAREYSTKSGSIDIFFKLKVSSFPFKHNPLGRFNIREASFARAASRCPGHNISS